MRLLGYLRSQWMGALALFLVIAGGTAYAANTIGSSDIIDNSVASVDLKNGEIRSADVRDSFQPNGGLAGIDIKDNTILGGNIVNGTIGTNDIGDGAVTGTDVADESLTNADILDGTLLGGDIANGTLGTNDYGDGSVTGTDIADNTITNADVAVNAGGGHAFTANGPNPLSVSVPAGAYVVLGQATLSNEDTDDQLADCTLQGQTVIHQILVDSFRSEVVPINATATLASPGNITIACDGFNIVAGDTRLTVIKVSRIN